MIRENRYLVLKWDDIHRYLSTGGFNQLEQLINEIEVGRHADWKDPRPEFVCIRSTWPEYEIVWKMLEERVDSENIIHSRPTH